MDTISASFSLQCINQIKYDPNKAESNTVELCGSAVSIAEPALLSTTMPSSTRSKKKTHLNMSIKASNLVESLSKNDNVWICDICSQMNTAMACSLCLRQRENALSWTANDEAHFDTKPSINKSNASSKSESSPEDYVENINRKENSQNVSPPLLGGGGGKPGMSISSSTKKLTQSDGPLSEIKVNSSAIERNAGIFKTKFSPVRPAGASPPLSDEENTQDAVTRKMQRKRINSNIISGNLKINYELSINNKITMDSQSYYEFPVTGNSNQIKHEQSSSRRNGNRQFVCHYTGCHIKFSDRSQLRSHFSLHRGDTPYMCPHDNCGQRFMYKASLQSHIRGHTGTLPYQCTIVGCSKRFATVGAWNIHRLLHEKHVEYRVCKARKVAQSTANTVIT